ncbi:MAG: hypothetical protein SGCHY_002759, partial [Lobulomycetales sp.]
QIQVSLGRLKKHTEELDELAKRETVSVKREKAIDRVSRARNDYTSMKSTFDAYKKQAAEAAQAETRNQLLEQQSSTTRRTLSSGGSGVSNAQSTDASIMQMGAMVKEADALHSSGRRLDEFIDIGRNALNELSEQRGMLKSSRKRMLDIANSLGLSANVIKYIEKRSAQDKWFLLAGIVISIILMWAIVHYLT